MRTKNPAMKNQEDFYIPKAIFTHKGSKLLRIKVIKKTGINSEYANEWISCKRIAIRYEDNPEKAYDWLKKYHYPLKKYTERDPECNTLTEKNKKQVRYLDRIVDEINNMLENYPKFDSKRIKTLTNRAFVLIYGEKEESYIKDKSSDFPFSKKRKNHS